MKAHWEYVNPEWGSVEIPNTQIDVSASLARVAGSNWVTIDGLCGNKGERLSFDLFAFLDELGVAVGMVSSNTAKRRILSDRRPRG